MTAPLPLICLIIALVFFALAAFFGYRYADGSRGWAIAVGLFFYALRDLFAVAVVVAALVLLAPTVAYADDGGGMFGPSLGSPSAWDGREIVVWDEGKESGVPKGVVGHDGVRCRGESTNGAVTYVNIGYIGADAGEMESDPSRERSWQEGHCRFMQELQHGWFWDRRGLPHQDVRVTVERV